MSDRRGKAGNDRRQLSLRRLVVLTTGLAVSFALLSVAEPRGTRILINSIAAMCAVGMGAAYCAALLRPVVDMVNNL
jgi:hypothetical protein